MVAMKTFDLLRTLREERGWSQKDMAEKLHMSVNGYAKIERGENSINLLRLQQIADALEVDIHELLPQAEGYQTYMIIKGDNNQGSNFYHGQQELVAEIDKLTQALAHKNEIIARLEAEVATLKEVIGLVKQRNAI